MPNRSDIASTSGPIVLAIDAGTTGVRTAAVNSSGTIVALGYRELTQHYPQPGWVEHDPVEIWESVLATMSEVMVAVGSTPVAIGITNQRETVVTWDRMSGAPLNNAIVWQDRRTAQRCAELAAAGWSPEVREATGLVLDPYFSATKIEWLERALGPQPNRVFGTVDAWLIWNLTGGSVFATDATNASRTMLLDIGSLTWSSSILDLFGVSASTLPEVRPSSGVIGTTTSTVPCGAGVPIAGVAGDQQAALFGHAAFDPGDAKNTYGTGSFVLMNVGTTCPPPAEGLLTTVAWVLEGPGGLETTYALEGSIFVTGAAVQWLRDGLGIIDNAGELEPLAASCPDSGGVVFVPALSGLGSPWWDPNARGTILGLTGGSGRAQLARAVIDAMVHQTRDVVDRMVQVTGKPLSRLGVDGGAAAMDLMLQQQADQLGVIVERPANTDTTVLGAAYLAGLAVGVWDSLSAIRQRNEQDRTFQPAGDRRMLDRSHRTWLRAVERSRDWIEESP